MKFPNSSSYVLNEVLDKVVQDICGEEGTGVWSNEEAVAQHIPAPTLTTAHYMRLASAQRGDRRKAKQTFGSDFPVQQLSDVGDKAAFLEDLRKAVYVTCLACFVQGLNIIESADKENKWDVDYSQVMQIWRAGCIIQADGIEDLIKPPMEGYKEDRKQGLSMNLLFRPEVAKALKDGFPSLKKVVLKGIEGDHCVPALGATLDYIKYSTSLGEFFSLPLSLFCLCILLQPTQCQKWNEIASR
jgi:6-phosphogluconate dehydrogenase